MIIKTSKVLRISHQIQVLDKIVQISCSHMSQTALYPFALYFQYTAVPRTGITTPVVIRFVTTTRIRSPNTVVDDIPLKSGCYLCSPAEVLLSSDAVRLDTSLYS